MMAISELSQRTLEKLYSTLEGVPTLNWKVLMTRGFGYLYSKDDVTIIESSDRPAKVLLDDLTYRGKTLQDLLEGLEAIGNKMAASIVKKGAQKIGLDMQYSGRRPPPPQLRSTGNPQEDVDAGQCFGLFPFLGAIRNIDLQRSIYSWIKLKKQED